MIFEYEFEDGTVQEVEIEGAEDMDPSTLMTEVYQMMKVERDFNKGLEDDFEFHDNTLSNMEIDAVNREQFEKFIDPMIVAEGGSKFTNDPVDSGGATKFGITFKTLKAYRGEDISVEDVKNLGRDEAVSIYHDMYYTKPKIDLINDVAVQEVVMDHGINAGPANGVRLLQRVLGVGVDGRMGPQTAAAVDEYTQKHGTTKLINEYSKARETYYRRLVERRPKDIKFLRGWLNRVEKTRAKLTTQQDEKDN